MQNAISFAAGTLVILAASEPVFAAPHDTRERARRRQAAEQARPSPEPVVLEPEFGELHLSLGIGGGNLGPAARAGGDLEYWALPTLGVGLLVAGVAQTAILGDGLSYWLVGPAVTLRERPAGNLFATLAAGYSAPHWTHAELLSSSTQLDTQGVALELQIGALSSHQALQLGAAVCIDAVFPPAHIGFGRAVTTLTLNFTVAASLR